MWLPKIVGRRGMSTHVISAIDIALWDLIGKALGILVHKLLGGFTHRIPCYIAGGYYEEGKGLKELAQEMEQNLDMGARAVKMKVGGVPINEDVERIRVVREAIGPDIKLLVDANNAYAAYEAIELARKMEPYDIFWFEEPVAPDDYRGTPQWRGQRQFRSRPARTSTPATIFAISSSMTRQPSSMQMPKFWVGSPNS